MMLADKKSISKVSLKEKDSKAVSTGLKNMQGLKKLDFDGAAGFVCDMHTGICGPAAQEKEGKE
jgi:hypothetical protein